MKKTILYIVGIMFFYAGATNVMASTPIEDVLSSINGSYEVVWAFNGSTKGWDWYAPGQPGNTLNYVDVKWGYWIKMTEAGTLNVTGTEDLPQTIVLYPGWNLIGYPKTTAGAIATALSTIAGNYEVVWLFNATTQGWDWYAPGQPGNTLNYMFPEFGYWIKMTTSDNLIVS